MLRLCLLLIVGPGLVVSCSDPDQPSTLPSDTPSATSSSVSASTSTDTPEEEVEAAVRAYYAELTRAAQTQETAEFKRLMTQGCPCYRVAKGIDATRDSGRTTPDAVWLVRTIQVHDVEARLAAAEVEYVVRAYRVLNTRGEVVDRYPLQRGHVDLSFVRSDDGWVVGNLFDLEG